MSRAADGRMQKEVQQKLMSHGIRPPCRVTVTVRNSVVPLGGTVQYEYQKKAAVRAYSDRTAIPSCRAS